MTLSLEYLHRKSILHRDIKPENLVFDDKGYLKITDLGIARVWNPDNSKDTSGTPGYMAPEVMRGEGYSVKSEMYSFGVVLYEIVSLEREWLPKGSFSGDSYGLSRPQDFSFRPSLKIFLVRKLQI